MARVTTKLQITVPRALAERFRIHPGDEIEWEAAGDAIRVVPRLEKPQGDVPTRLKLFDQATARQRAQQKVARPATPRSRGWTREDLSLRDRRGRESIRLNWTE